MFITYIHNIEHRNLETQKYLRLLCSGTKLFITFEFKGSSTQGERYTFFLFWHFHLHTPLSRAAHVVRKFVWPLRAPKVDPSRSVSSSKLNQLTFSNLTKSSVPPVYNVIQIPLSGIFILTSLNDTSAPRAREDLRSCCT